MCSDDEYDEVYKNALKANAEDLEEPLALPVEEVEEAPVADEKIEDVVDEEDNIESEVVVPSDEDVIDEDDADSREDFEDADEV